MNSFGIVLRCTKIRSAFVVSASESGSEHFFALFVFHRESKANERYECLWSRCFGRRSKNYGLQPHNGLVEMNESRINKAKYISSVSFGPFPNVETEKNIYTITVK